MSRFLLCALLAASAYAGSPLYQASFDGSGGHWTAVHGAAVLDPSVQRAGQKSLRVESGTSGDACVRSAPITLTIGKRYELSGWVRTEGLEVRDLNRSPIATGATLTMASMPFDVHSSSSAARTIGHASR